MNWPLEIDEEEYQPIPDSWIQHGDDHDTGTPRVFATSVAHAGRQRIKIRFLHPTQPHVHVASMQAVETEDGLVPALLDNPRGSWPRSLVPPSGQDPDSVARSAEIEHLRELWAERTDQIPEDKSIAIADGGRAVRALGDPLQCHLGGESR